MDHYKNDYQVKPRFNKPKQPRPHDCNYYVEVRDGEDPVRAYRRIKKKIKESFLDVNIIAETMSQDGDSKMRPLLLCKNSN